MGKVSECELNHCDFENEKYKHSKDTEKAI